MKNIRLTDFKIFSCFRSKIQSWQEKRKRFPSLSTLPFPFACPVECHSFALPNSFLQPLGLSKKTSAWASTFLWKQIVTFMFASFRFPESKIVDTLGIGTSCYPSWVKTKFCLETFWWPLPAEFQFRVNIKHLRANEFNHLCPKNLKNRWSKRDCQEVKQTDEVDALVEWTVFVFSGIQSVLLPRFVDTFCSHFQKKCLTDSQMCHTELIRSALESPDPDASTSDSNFEIQAVGADLELFEVARLPQNKLEGTKNFMKMRCVKPRVILQLWKNSFAWFHRL